MKRVEQIAFCLVIALTGIAIVRADDTAPSGEPYATVVARNIFGLNPAPPPDAHALDANPPPKIIPNGIMDILGELQVLFKVAQPPRPGSPATPDESYILSQGQRQDEIEVVKIDQKNSVVTFNNHGETQTLPLVTTMPASTPSAGLEAPAVGRPGGPGGRFSPGFVNPGGGPGGRVPHGAGGANNSGALPGSPSNPGNSSNLSNPDNSTGLGGAPAQLGSYNAASQLPEGMTPETQTVLIEANRMQAQQQGDPVAKIFTITAITPPTQIRVMETTKIRHRNHKKIVIYAFAEFLADSISSQNLGFS